LAAGYKNKSQVARVVTEAWARDNMYCPACPSDSLDRLKANTKVLDFQCPRCEEKFQLKAKDGSIGSVVANSAYEPKIQAIMTHANPSYAFLQYDPKPMQVASLFVVPRFFFSPDIIQKRAPLSASARRHGWVGSNILLGNLPLDARIYVVRDGYITSERDVRNAWSRFVFMDKVKVASRGWLNDVLLCVRELGRHEFALADVYGFTNRLAELHPDNKHVRDKIRQQLQILDKYGIIRRIVPGRYKVL
jgi:type II restriction enzyme